MNLLLDTCGALLLLFHLLVLKAAAQCSKHPGGENVVFTQKTLLMNDFPDGCEITFECAAGYIVESGSASSTCVNGNWSFLDLKCKRKDCGPPKPQDHMTFNISGGTLFGDVIKVTCDEGFQIRGTSYKQCYALGWSGRSSCEVVTCPLPAVVDNGRSLWNSEDQPKYGESVQYVCDAGYTLVGHSTIRCGRGGNYDPPPPQCKGSSDIGTTGDRNTTDTTSAQDESTTSSTSPGSESTASSRHTVTSGVIVTTAGRTTSKTATSSPTTTATTTATTTTTTTTAALSLRGREDNVVDVSVNNGHLPVTISVTFVTLVAVVIIFFLHKFLKRRKGSARGTAPIS